MAIERQQQENDKMKKSLALSKYIAADHEKKTINATMPNQFSRVKNKAKSEEVIKDNKE
jgi:hypothetical protein